jgi:lipopolysaccharide/colanic/teichoic acid biosynthesis glycosyltransferase
MATTKAVRQCLQGLQVEGTVSSMGEAAKIVTPATQNDLDGFAGKVSSKVGTQTARRATVYGQEIFQSMLTRERWRAERSRKPFVLMLLDAHQEQRVAEKLLLQALTAVGSQTRQTDLVGWYKQSAVVGIIFTELGGDERAPIVEALNTKIRGTLHENLGRDQASKIAISFHVFPEQWDPNHAEWVADPKLYPDLKSQLSRKKFPQGVKRAMDMAGSGALLLIMFPILLVIAAIIKLTSEGPVLFSQQRLGKFGARFKCLKFRTMNMNCAPQIHQEYVQRFISGKVDDESSTSAEPAVYKLTNDPRVTKIGQFLRKTSLDELPQLWNVLVGEMSLVGPRPPVPYEFEIYDIWHRRRVLEVKPGITGLWQVSGRSRTRFDDMVRLDLRYCQSWSLWLDIKILMATPAAAFWGDGAY